MKKYVSFILAGLLLLSVIANIFLYRDLKDREDTIEIKNQRIQELKVSAYNYKMAEEEAYELFLNCVYPDGIPEDVEE